MHEARSLNDHEDIEMPVEGYDTRRVLRTDSRNAKEDQGEVQANTHECNRARGQGIVKRKRESWCNESRVLDTSIFGPAMIIRSRSRF